MPINQTVGRKIKALRKSKGLTREQVARKVGVCQQQIHKYETGESRVSLDKLYAIAGALGVDIDYFLTN